MINRETATNIGWGVASWNKNTGYRLVETRSTRTAAREETNRRNANATTAQYRTVRLGAFHP